MTNFIYAFDFDGVICDSAVETAMTGWQAAGEIWPELVKPVQPNLVEQFRKVRPLIETGYEAILVMRLLFLDPTISQDLAAFAQCYPDKLQQLCQQGNLTIDQLKALFGATRDKWIATAENDWLKMNPLFPGIAESLQSLPNNSPWYIITTKQERFAQRILQANGITIANENIFGLDRKMSKAEVLQQISQQHPNHTIFFLEDRVETLLNIAQKPTLAKVNLAFADWGYSTPEHQQIALQQDFEFLSLADFVALIKPNTWQP